MRSLRQTSNPACSNQSERPNNRGNKKHSSVSLSDGGRSNKKARKKPSKLHPVVQELVSSGEVRVDDTKIGVVDLKFNLTSDERITHFGMRGRATAVFPVESVALSALVPQLPHHNPHNPTDKLVAKLYWPEEGRESEVDILQKVYEIAKKDEEGKVKHHVPELVWSRMFEDTSAANIRRALGIDDAETGRRAFYIIVFRELFLITKLSGDEFLSAWWQTVVCHYALWENGVHHRDISPSNLMVYKTSDGRWIGVLNDFDLSSTRDTPSGQERTGTVPFMALHLLTKKGIEGQVKHMYQHDAESFIWVLTWVCICYEGGAYIGKGTDLHQWLKVDARGCLKEKSDFLYSGRRTITPSSSYEGIWKVARFCLLTICQHYVPEVVPTMEDQVVFETWLRKNILEANILSPALLDPTSDSPPAHIPPQATPDPAQPHPDPSHGVNNRHTAIRWLQKSSDPHILRAGEQAPFRVRTGDQPSHEPSRRSLLESTQNDVDREHSKDLSNPRNQ